MIDLLYEYNDDNLMLQGTYFDSRKKDICILFIHGQAQSILNNKFAYEFGKYFSKNGISFLYIPISIFLFLICIIIKLIFLY